MRYVLLGLWVCLTLNWSVVEAWAIDYTDATYPIYAGETIDGTATTIKTDKDGYVLLSPQSSCEQRMRQAMWDMEPAIHSYNWVKEHRPNHDFRAYYENLDATLAQWETVMRDCVKEKP